MQIRQKRRILPDTMIQEIGRSVKCQKLNKFISRTPKLSVNKPKDLRGDQFPGDPRWLSGQAGTFFPLTVLSRRNLTPRQTRPLPGNARELLPAGALRSNVVGTYGSPTNAPSLKCPLRGDQFPGDPRWLSRQTSAFYPLTVLPRRNLTPRQTRPLPGNARELLPAGAGGSVPWRPTMAERAGGRLFPSHSPACRA